MSGRQLTSDDMRQVTKQLNDFKINEFMRSIGAKWNDEDQTWRVSQATAGKLYAALGASA